MFVVTNRNLEPERKGLEQFGPRVNSRGPNELRMVEVTRARGGWKVEIVPDKLDDDPEGRWCERAGIDDAWLQQMGFDPAQPVYGSSYVAKRVLDRVTPGRGGRGGSGRHLLVFVHGFNNDIKDVVERAAAFEKNYRVEVLAFSWPANGGGATGVASYRSDKNDSKASVGALDRMLAKLNDMMRRFNASWVAQIIARAEARHPDNAQAARELAARTIDQGCPFTVNLVAHSMGNYLLKHMLLSTSSMGTGLIFDNVVLASADTNNPEHALWVERIRARRRVFVTINENDSALRLSRMKLGETQLARLGHYPYELFARGTVYVDFTNAPKVADSHAYFEGLALENARIKRFFKEAFTGLDAERQLAYDDARNAYLLHVPPGRKRL